MNSVPAYVERAGKQYRLQKARAASLPSWLGKKADLRQPHPRQKEFIESDTKRKIIRAGRRGGKTTGIALLAFQAFLAGRRVLYATPTSEQIATFWTEVTTAFAEAIEAGILYKNETSHLIELPGTPARIRAKTAWNADTLRGDYADLLILDEWQLMHEDAWERVGAPMLLDNNGDAVFIYTPPSLHSKYKTRAHNSMHAAEMFKKAQADTTGRWETFHFSSHDNPHINEEALAEITQDMSALAYEQEILALDKDEAPGALWTRQQIDSFRVERMPALARLVVGIDPPGGAVDAGIVVAGLGTNGHGYVLDDVSLKDTPEQWALAAVRAYHDWEADWLVVETNFGGDMVKTVVRSVPGGKDVRFKAVRASRGKAVRAEPISAFYQQGRVHHVGRLPLLEDEYCYWIPGSGMASPNRLDAAVWALTELMIKEKRSATSRQG